MTRRNTSFWAAVCLALSTVIWIGLPAARPAAAATPWTGTWAVAPQSSGTTFNNQTLRQIVHTSISGSAARIHLSNAFGNQAVRIADVHIAQRTSGSSVNLGTDRTVTFGGQTSTTIPAGGSAVSDSIAFAVNAQSDVAISIFLPNGTGPATFHQVGNQTNFSVSGDAGGNGSLANAQTFGSYFFLANLDVQNTAALGAVVTLGASITDGIASRSDVNRRWPNDLASRLISAGQTVGVLNEGISGNQLLRDGAGQSALNRFSRDVLSQPNVRWVIFADDPINDLGSNNPPPSSTQLINGIQQLISQAHQAGIKFFCSTLTPFQGSGGWSPNNETERGAIDSFIRGAGSGCDAIVDQDTATHDPAHPTQYLPSLDSGDHLHPNEGGLQAIANAVPLNAFGSATGGGTPVISLRAHANNMIVTADNAGASPLIANRTAIGTWEQFDELDQGNGNIALRAHANGNIVSADNAGASPLIANRTAVGPWE
ncbi:MAG TPA: GDSL-type esterase/lipase family protein, partial [Pseudonocardiaceae bacterium]